MKCTRQSQDTTKAVSYDVDVGQDRENLKRRTDRETVLEPGSYSFAPGLYRFEGSSWL